MGAGPTEVHPEYKGRTTGEKMKALAWFGPQDVRIIEAPVPDITEPDDVILKVTGTTICGSDLHLYHGEIVTLQKGDILGHGMPLFHGHDIYLLRGNDSQSSWESLTKLAPVLATSKSATES